jgi:hypothetical protein
MTEQFGRTAVSLAQGPLGIIALFIVLIDAFASLVLGLASNIGENNRSILVWFLVLFPVGVFAVFSWLVSRHHTNLYPPQAFRNEQVFRDLAYGRSSFDRRIFGARHSEVAEATTRSLKAEATGNLYWLGHDLMWTADTLLRGGPTRKVLIGLAQALHNLIQVGLERTLMKRELVEMQESIQRDQSQEIPSASRDIYAAQLGSIIDRIGVIAEKGQADFSMPPHWSRARD